MTCLASCTDATTCNNCVTAAPSAAQTQYDNYANCVCTMACMSQCTAECGA
jgi:hypothetical protein